jgi:hypothetical protein
MSKCAQSITFCLYKMRSLIIAFCLILGVLVTTTTAATHIDSHDDSFALTPSGARMHRSCFHSVPALEQIAPLSHIESDANHGDRLVFSDGSVKMLPRCPYAPQPQLKMKHTSSAARWNETSGYYSNWVAYAGYTHPTDDLASMTSTWTVPSAPPQPGLLTTVFFFNGLQQQLHNTTAIYQPVLQFGYSGCGGAFAWTMTAFVVTDAGRAYCGQMLSVRPGDVVRGNLTRTASSISLSLASTSVSTSTGDPWTITAEVLSQPQLPVSRIAAVSPIPMRFACIVLEAIRMYSCPEYPASSPIVFQQNHLLVASGQELTHVPWNVTINHSECAQAVTIGAGATPDVAISVKSG